MISHKLLLTAIVLCLMISALVAGTTILGRSIGSEGLALTTVGKMYLVDPERQIEHTMQAERDTTLLRDGRLIFLLRQPKAREPLGLPPPYVSGLDIQNMRGRSLRKMTFDEPFDWSYPTLSANEKWFGIGLYLVNIDSGEVQRLPGERVEFRTWMPNDTDYVVQQYGASGSDDVQNGLVFKSLLKDDAQFYAGYRLDWTDMDAWQPSPDSRAFAFHDVADELNDEDYELVIIMTDTQTVHRIPQISGEKQWSPDSRALLVHPSEADASHELLLIDAATGARQTFPLPQHDRVGAVEFQWLSPEQVILTVRHRLTETTGITRFYTLDILTGAYKLIHEDPLNHIQFRLNSAAGKVLYLSPNSPAIPPLQPGVFIRELDIATGEITRQWDSPFYWSSQWLEDPYKFILYGEVQNNRQSGTIHVYLLDFRAGEQVQILNNIYLFSTIQARLIH